MFSLLSLTATGIRRSYEAIRRLGEADIVVYNSTRVAMGIGYRLGLLREQSLVAGSMNAMLSKDLYKLLSLVSGVRGSGQTFVIATHDILVARGCTKIYTVRDGKIESVYSPSDIGRALALH